MAAFAQAVVIFNPTSGRRRERWRPVERFCRTVQSLGIPITPLATRGPFDAAGLAAQAVVGGADLVIAHGGDGTVNEVLQGMVGTQSTLAVWAGGTADVLAAHLHMPRSPVALAQRIAVGRRQRVAVGVAGQRYYLLMAGLGFDAAVVAGVPPGLKRGLGKAAFALTAIPQLWRYRPQPFQLVVDGELVVGTFAVIAKSPGYGGGFRFCPGASLVEPNLEACVFQVPQTTGFLPYVVPAFFGRHTRMAGVAMRRARVVEAMPLAGPVPVQLDGELAGQLPMRFTAVPDAVTLLV